MPPKPPVYAPIDPGPRELTPEELCADGALQVPAAAAFLGIGRSAVKEMIRTREVPSMIVKGRRVIPKRALVLYLAKQLQADVVSRGVLWSVRP